jgi:hypothetical protein
MDVTRDPRTLLEQLGTTADEVAVVLRANAVQGVRNAVRVLNPIIRHMQIALRMDNFDADVMTGKTLRIHNGGTKQEVMLPQAVRDFMEAFNGGAYPDLELPPDKK